MLSNLNLIERAYQLDTSVPPQLFELIDRSIADYLTEPPVLQSNEEFKSAVL